MSSYPETQKIKEVIDSAHTVVIVQADNPDGDSLASALALEQILGDLGKEPYLYCGVDIPSYLHYLPGWDRVNKDLPSNFDASIVVDTSSITLLETLQRNNQTGWLASKPCIVIDHHEVDISIPFASVILNQPVVATGEAIYELAQQLKWPLNQSAKNMISISILSDSLGLISEGTSARSIHIIAELVDNGVKLGELEKARREMMRKSPELIRYKGKLLGRIEYQLDNKIAMITIPWEEIEKYSQAYNPPMLVLDDMRLTENTDIAVAFKLYKDGKITAKIRTNYGVNIAGELAKHFGGGGHPYASGFKITDGRSIDEIKAETIKKTAELLTAKRE